MLRVLVGSFRVQLSPSSESVLLLSISGTPAYISSSLLSHISGRLQSLAPPWSTKGSGPFRAPLKTSESRVLQIRFPTSTGSFSTRISTSKRKTKRVGGASSACPSLASAAKDGLRAAGGKTTPFLMSTARPGSSQPTAEDQERKSNPSVRAGLRLQPGFPNLILGPHTFVPVSSLAVPLHPTKTNLSQH